jgi:anaphase-promoting complex subunit 4
MVCPGRISVAVCTKYMITGQAIALIHHPPRITVHSVQDGREANSPPLIDEIPESTRLTGVWWFKDERQAEADSIPDIFKRGADIV